ncbi:MAG: response regulator [Clostridiales bacterium]|jgi:CheY-like chemotaxis protein|nr:response regulator [Clostridiales bacterium]
MAKILVIEDEPDQNKLIKLRLEARGYRVMSVGKAKEGIELAKKERPQLILMDMILPDMHGLDATIKLKQNTETRNIPIIALSAVGSPDFIKACSQEGIAAYIKKPYDPRELFRTIEKFVAVEEPEEKAKPRAESARNFEEEIHRIEKEFRARHFPGPKEKKPKAPDKDRKKIDDLIKTTLSDFKMPSKKTTQAIEEKVKRPVAKAAGPKVILIMDDDVAFGRAMTATLASRGYEVTVALDGISGLQHAFQKKPDLILLNLVLPPAGGGENVLANLRKAPETQFIPVFLMSSLFSPKKMEEKAKELGAQGFIAKPIEPEDLTYIIESIIGE